ncbi:MAG: replicative DNA helicase [Candidatus Cloacimonetes bacterium]|nr:replicative DNA helicase [Candidatus Cloacimonadota bacterium]
MSETQETGKYDNRLLQKQLPSDLNAEAAILSAMLIDDYNVSKVMTSLTEKDFYRNSHKMIFRAMQKLFNEDIEIDLITLTNELKKTGEFEKVGGLAFLNDLSEVVMSGANVGEYVKILNEKSTLRQLITSCNNILEECYNTENEAELVLDHAEQQIFEILENPSKESFNNMRNEVEDTIVLIQAIANKTADLFAVNTGFTDLDSHLGGFRKGQLIVLAARPAMGKSSLALNIAFNAAISYKKKVAVFTLEMESQELIMRLLSSAAEIPMQRMIRGYDIDESVINRIIGVGNALQDCEIYIDDSGYQNLNQIRAKSRRLKREAKGLDLIIIDYLQLMAANNPRGRENRQQEISEISRGLKILAKEMGLPVIALSQLNRQVENRDDKRPVLADLRESGAIEQDADIVMFIYRDEVYNENSEDKGKAEVLIRKNRHGSIGKVTLKFFKEYTAFRDLSREDK